MAPRTTGASFDPKEGTLNNVRMKNCVIWGDMSSDRASEQYPEVPVCTDCIAAEQARGENSQIVTVGDDVTDQSATCALCDCGFDE